MRWRDRRPLRSLHANVGAVGLGASCRALPLCDAACAAMGAWPSIERRALPAPASR
jgi:hypothetical protein